MYCQNCGKEVISNGKFCHWCGAGFPKQSYKSTSATEKGVSKSKFVALLFNSIAGLVLFLALPVTIHIYEWEGVIGLEGQFQWFFHWFDASSVPQLIASGIIICSVLLIWASASKKRILGIILSSLNILIIDIFLMVFLYADYIYFVGLYIPLFINISSLILFCVRD